MAKTLKSGDKVEWDSSQGVVRGTVIAKVTKPMMIKSHKVTASPDKPEYLVESDKTGAKAAHLPKEIRKR